MSKNDDLQLLKIKELFNDKEQYVIPIYQRNYAWGATEIEQLVQDIYDASGSSEALSGTKETHYFLGSLVVNVRDHGANNSNKIYETIDGQQRHTTLSILLAFLKNKQSEKELNLEGIDLKYLDLNRWFSSYLSPIS